MTDPLSLGPVLDLIERWQQQEKWNHDPLHDSSCSSCSLMCVDIAAIRQLAEQHAAQLREAADLLDDYYSGQSYVPTKVNAAADFLAAPRREPEAE